MKAFFAHPVVILILKIVVSASLLVGLIFFIDVGSLVRSLRQANLGFIALGFALIIVNIGIHFLRWRYVLRLVSHEIPNGEVFVSLLVGITAGIFTPGQIGEFAGRIASHPHLKKSDIVGVSLIDKLYLLGLTLITGIAAVIIFAALYWRDYFTVFYAVFGISIALIITVVFLFPEITKKIFAFVPRKIKEHKVYKIIGIIETTFHNPQGRVLFGLTLLLYGAIFFQFYIFISAFQQISIFDSFICSSSVYFVKTIILPVSFGDLGVRESASVFFFSKVGIASASAFNASLFMFITNLVVPSLAGALLVLKLKLK